MTRQNKSNQIRGGPAKFAGHAQINVQSGKGKSTQAIVPVLSVDLSESPDPKMQEVLCYLTLF